MKESLIGELENIVSKENLLASPEALRAYSYDGTTARSISLMLLSSLPPQIEISLILGLPTGRESLLLRRGRYKHQRRIVPINGGIVLCTTKMNKILKIDKESLSATVEPGVVLQDLTLRLAQDGLFFPPDPQSFLGATLAVLSRRTAAGPPV